MIITKIIKENTLKDYPKELKNLRKAYWRTLKSLERDANNLYSDTSSAYENAQDEMENARANIETAMVGTFPTHFSIIIIATARKTFLSTLLANPGDVVRWSCVPGQDLSLDGPLAPSAIEDASLHVRQLDAAEAGRFTLAQDEAGPADEAGRRSAEARPVPLRAKKHALGAAMSEQRPSWV